MLYLLRMKMMAHFQAMSYARQATRAQFYLLLIVLAGCNSSDDNLANVVAFEGAAECQFALETRRIFGTMMDYNRDLDADRPGGLIEIAQVGRLQPTFRGPDDDGMVHAQLPLEGAWHGLTITGLESGFVPNTGVHYRRILFAEAPQAVREKLNPMGFQLPPAGGVREFGDGMTEYISVDRRGSGSALECGT